jgi:uncharacterized protein (TIGR00251 family)
VSPDRCVFWSADPFGLVLTVRLKPKAGRDAIDGTVRLSDGRAVLAARVRALPTEGEANAALVRLLARSLHVAPSRVQIEAGTSGRVKRIRVEGDPAALAAILEKLAST